MLPPPKSASFIIAVAVLTTVIFAPLDIVFFLVLNVICCRRPVFEMIGVNSFRLLGSDVPQTQLETKVNHHLLSVLEEDQAISAVLMSFRVFLERCRRGECSDLEIHRMKQVARRIGLTLGDSAIRLTLFSYLRFGDNLRACVGHHIHQSRINAQSVLTNLQRLGDETAKSTYLLQQYILEHFSFLFQIALKRQFMHFCFELPQTIHPVLWLLGWAFEIASVLFFIAWILQWGLQASTDSIGSWGINCGLNLFQEIFLISLIRVFFINIFVVELSRPMLRGVYQHLRSLEEAKVVVDVDTEDSEIEKYFSPSLILAEEDSLTELRASQIIKQTSDAQEYDLRMSRFSNRFSKRVEESTMHAINLRRVEDEEEFIEV